MSGLITLLVTGSRALSDFDAASDWASEGILSVFCERPDDVLLVVTGDARGPDRDAADIADAALVWHRRGYVHVKGAAPVVARWCNDPLPMDGDHAAWKARLLARDRAMVAWVATQPGDRRCLALIAPWSRTHGTEYTARKAEEAGIVVTRLICPTEYGPEGMR